MQLLRVAKHGFQFNRPSLTKYDSILSLTEDLKKRALRDLQQFNRKYHRSRSITQTNSFTNKSQVQHNPQPLTRSGLLQSQPTSKKNKAQLKQLNTNQITKSALFSNISTQQGNAIESIDNQLKIRQQQMNWLQEYLILELKVPPKQLASVSASTITVSAFHPQSLTFQELQFDLLGGKSKPVGELELDLDRSPFLHRHFSFKQGVPKIADHQFYSNEYMFFNLPFDQALIYKELAKRNIPTKTMQIAYCVLGLPAYVRVVVKQSSNVDEFQIDKRKVAVRSKKDEEGLQLKKRQLLIECKGTSIADLVLQASKYGRVMHVDAPHRIAREPTVKEVKAFYNNFDGLVQIHSYTADGTVHSQFYPPAEPMSHASKIADDFLEKILAYQRMYQRRMQFAEQIKVKQGFQGQARIQSCGYAILTFSLPEEAKSFYFANAYRYRIHLLQSHEPFEFDEHYRRALLRKVNRQSLYSQKLYAETHKEDPDDRSKTVLQYLQQTPNLNVLQQNSRQYRFLLDRLKRRVNPMRRSSFEEVVEKEMFGRVLSHRPRPNLRVGRPVRKVSEKEIFKVMYAQRHENQRLYDLKRLSYEKGRNNYRANKRKARQLRQQSNQSKNQPVDAGKIKQFLKEQAKRTGKFDMTLQEIQQFKQILDQDTKEIRFYDNFSTQQLKYNFQTFEQDESIRNSKEQEEAEGITYNEQANVQIGNSEEAQAGQAVTEEQVLAEQLAEIPPSDDVNKPNRAGFASCPPKKEYRPRKGGQKVLYLRRLSRFLRRTIDEYLGVFPQNQLNDINKGNRGTYLNPQDLRDSKGKEFLQEDQIQQILQFHRNFQQAQILYQEYFLLKQFVLSQKITVPQILKKSLSSSFQRMQFLTDNGFVQENYKVNNPQDLQLKVKQLNTLEATLGEEYRTEIKNNDCYLLKIRKFEHLCPLDRIARIENMIKEANLTPQQIEIIVNNAEDILSQNMVPAKVMEAFGEKPVDTDFDQVLLAIGLTKNDVQMIIKISALSEEQIENDLLLQMEIEKVRIKHRETKEEHMAKDTSAIQTKNREGFFQVSRYKQL